MERETEIDREGNREEDMRRWMSQCGVCVCAQASERAREREKERERGREYG